MSRAPYGLEMAERSDRRTGIKLDTLDANQLKEMKRELLRRMGIASRKEKNILVDELNILQNELNRKLREEELEQPRKRQKGTGYSKIITDVSGGGPIISKLRGNRRGRVTQDPTQDPNPWRRPVEGITAEEKEEAEKEKQEQVVQMKKQRMKEEAVRMHAQLKTQKLPLHVVKRRKPK